MSKFTDTLSRHEDARLYAEIDKRDERVARLEYLLKLGMDGNSTLWKEHVNKVLSESSSDTWLADKIKEAELKVLEAAADMLRAYSQDTAATQIENMAEARRAK